MTDNTKNGLLKKQTWTEEEIAEVKQLLNICDAYEDLAIKISPAMLRVRPANSINDFLWYEDGILAGLLSLHDMGEEEREMTGMVHPDYRRKGIFTQLFEAAKAEARSRGITRLILVCERFSRAGLGFVQSTGAEYDFSEHKMRLTNFKPRDQFSEKIRLQLAGLDDVDDIARITSAGFGQSEEGAREHTLQRMQDMSHNEYCLAKWNDQPVGAFNLYKDDTSTGIYAFVVLPEYRGRGYGRQMLEQIIISLQAENIKPVELEVDTTNTNAYMLYRSCGFTEITTYGYYNFDI